MALILNIDTATETAQISFAKDGIVLQSLSNDLQKDHAAFLQTAIQQLLKNVGVSLNNIDAIAVAAGPGSYTGLRVGMASAKGLCYALNKPLIVLNTLEILTIAAQQQFKNPVEILFCPMIDARRMEVFTAVYNNSLNTSLPPCAMILQEDSFLNQLKENRIVFFGTGAAKWKTICKHSNASFTIVLNLPQAMAYLSNTYFLQNNFANLVYSQPFYIKEFQNNI